jgi:hypothetical protein
MKGCIVNIARLLARILAVLFAILSFLVLVVLSLAFSLERQAFNPAIYKALLAERQLYAHLPVLVAEQLTFTLPGAECLEGGEACADEPESRPKGQLLGASSELLACLQDTLSQAEYTAFESGKQPLVDNSAASKLVKPCLKQHGLPPNAQVNLGGMPAYFWMLEAADWQVILTELLPPDWTQKSIESAIDQIFERLNAPAENAPPIRISLVSMKERLNGEAGERVLAQVFAAQPPCPAGSAGIALEMPGPGEEGPTELCRPANAFFAAAVAQSKITLSAVSNEIPDEATLAFPDPGVGGPPGSGPDFEEVAAVRKMLRLGLALPVLLLGLTALFGARSWRGLLLWWGLPFLAAGGLVTALGLAAPPVVMKFLNPLIAEKLGGSPLTPNLQAEILALAQAAVQRFSTGIAIAGGIALVFGLALLGGAFIFREKTGPTIESVPAEQAQVKDPAIRSGISPE